MSVTIEKLVDREVHYCVSYLVSTLAGAVYTGDNFPASGTDLQSLVEQAFELAAPIDDWDEAAIQAGWALQVAGDWKRATGPDDWPNSGFGSLPFMVRKTAQSACETDGVDPHQSEVLEHWIVSDWLADKLEAHGEKVDRDFAGMTVWARTCSGQSITLDSVIERIHAELTA